MCLINLRHDSIRETGAIHLHGISATSTHADAGERVASLVSLAR